MSPSEPIVFVVDDEAPIRRAMARLLKFAGFRVADFAGPREFLAAYDGTQPGCLVLDIAMPGFSGLDLQRVLAERGLAIPIIFLTGRADIPMTVRAMKAGAIDFLTKPVRDTVLLEAIRRALDRDAAQRNDEAELAELRERVRSLSTREMEVLHYVTAGWLNKQIAVELGVVEQTIKAHRARMLNKLQVRSVADLVRLVERLKFDGGSEIG